MTRFKVIIFLEHFGLFKNSEKISLNVLKNKTAAQAAGADPSQCNSTSRQNPAIQQNRSNFLPNTVNELINESVAVEPWGDS